jgi:hypothetical protein
MKPAGQPYPCRSHAVCEGDHHVFYGWGRNAPELHFPKGVGVAVGASTSASMVVLQVRPVPSPIRFHVASLRSGRTQRSGALYSSEHIKRKFPNSPNPEGFRDNTPKLVCHLLRISIAKVPCKAT